MKTRQFLFFVVPALLLSLLAVARADDARQTVWLLSTRNAPHCGELQDGSSEIRYWKMENCDWKPSDKRDFQESYAGPTVVFIPGNRSDADDTVEKGCILLPMLRSAAEGKSFRYVIWSWPADRVCRRNRRDVQLKVNFGQAESYYLAHWMARLQPGVKVSLIGHSLGAPIIADAMLLLAGGEVAGRTVPQKTVDEWKGGKRNTVNAVFLAAALDTDWFSADEHSKSLSLFNKALVTENCCERVLRWYPWLWGRGGPQAMGYVGPGGIDTEKVEVLDVSTSVGKHHDYRLYCTAPSVCSQWARYAFFVDSPLQSAP